MSSYTSVTCIFRVALTQDVPDPSSKREREQGSEGAREGGRESE